MWSNIDLINFEGDDYVRELYGNVYSDEELEVIMKAIAMSNDELSKVLNVNT